MFFKSIARVHLPDPTLDPAPRTGDALYFRVHVAQDPLDRAGDPYREDDRARLDPVAPHEMRHPGSCHHDVHDPGVLGDVARRLVAERHRGVDDTLCQHQTQGTTDRDAAPDDAHLRPGQHLLQRLNTVLRYSRADPASTLVAYLRHRGQWDAAARDLWVHRNTVRHRILTVRELIAADPDNPDVAAEL